MKNLLFPILLLVCLTQFSCVKHTQLLNFRGESEFRPLKGHEISNQVRIKIQPDDVLFILVRALEQETAEPYNLFPSRNINTLSNSTNPTLQGYLVDTDGYIDFPVLGRLKIGDKTIEEAKEYIINELRPSLKDPVVTIRFMNFRLTVLGEVTIPRTFTIQGERITILEALGQAGDLTPYSNRENILVMREQAGKREFGYINIQSPDVFKSPYFYLQQNDVIYVEPIKQATATVRDPITEALPIFSGVVSLTALILAILR